jgi:hypothetical protein
MAVCSSPGSRLKGLYEGTCNTVRSAKRAHSFYYRSNLGTRPEIMDSNIVPYKVPLKKFIYSGSIERKKVNSRGDDDFKFAVEQATAPAGLAALIQQYQRFSLAIFKVKARQTITEATILF